MSSAYILHPQGLHVLDQLEFALAHLQRTGKAMGFRVTGPTNSGKTAAMLELCRRYPPVEGPNGRQYPVLYVHLPERARLADVYIATLEALGDPAAHLGTERVNRFRVRKLLAAAAPRIVVFDEPHHVTAGRSEGARVALVQFSKSIGDDLKVCIVYTGVKAVDDLVQESDELARRFRTKLTLGPYDLGSVKDLKTLRTFCDAVGQALTAVKPISLGTQNWWFMRLAVASKGLVGTIVQLTLLAESYANSAGEAELTRRHFSKAWEFFTTSEEQSLLHLKSKVTGKLANVFELDDDAVQALFGEVATKVAT